LCFSFQFLTLSFLRITLFCLLFLFLCFSHLSCFHIIFTVHFIFLFCNNPLIHASFVSVFVFVLSLFLFHAIHFLFHYVLCSCSSYLFFSLICFPFRFLFIFSWLLSLYSPYSCLTPRSRQISDPPVDTFNQSPPSTHTHPSLCAWRPTSVAIQFISLQHILIHVTWPAEPRRLV
jgi:hypothetical protein